MYWQNNRRCADDETQVWHRCGYIDSPTWGREGKDDDGDDGNTRCALLASSSSSILPLSLSSSSLYRPAYTPPIIVWIQDRIKSRNPHHENLPRVISKRPLSRYCFVKLSVLGTLALALALALALFALFALALKKKKARKKKNWSLSSTILFLRLCRIGGNF